MERIKKISLNSNDINRSIRELKQIKTNIENTNIEDILDDAVKYCVSMTPISDYEGNHLAFNTYWVKTPNGYRIVQEGENVAFVEFGTGVKGANNSHPNTNKFGWVYGIGSHIFETKNGKTGWFFPINENKTSYKFTEGQKASMQMYKTALYLRERLGVEVKTKLERVISKW